MSPFSACNIRKTTLSFLVTNHIESNILGATEEKNMYTFLTLWCKLKGLHTCLFQDCFHCQYFENLGDTLIMQIWKKERDFELDENPHGH